LGPLPTPTAINGKADTTICQGATTTFKTTRVAGATSYSWSFARNGGTIIGASNDTSIVVRWNNNAAGDTVYVKAKNTCDSSVAQKIAIIVINFANLDAGPNRPVSAVVFLADGQRLQRQARISQTTRRPPQASM
jgi:PKD-like domain/Ig-like domain CHU_C associated